MPSTITVEEVLAFLQKWMNAYAGADISFFDAFTNDASLFTLSTPTRVDGRQEFQHGFESRFVGRPRTAQVLSPEVRLVGDAAVVTFHLRVLVRGISTNLRATLVVVKEQGRLQIAHLHYSPLGYPGTSTRGLPSEELALLEERVEASIADVL